MFYLKGFGCKATVTTEKFRFFLSLSIESSYYPVLSFQIEVRSTVRPPGVKNQCKKSRLPRDKIDIRRLYHVQLTPN